MTIENNPGQENTNAGDQQQQQNQQNQEQTKSPSTVQEFHDAAISATEAWQADPSNEELKTKAKEAVTKAKESYATESKAREEAEKKKKEEIKSPPAEYKNLKLPENSPLGKEHLERIASEAKERGLSEKDAQDLLDRDVALIATFKEKQIEETKQLSDQWLVSSKDDKEFGGETFVQNAELAKRVVSRFGSDEFKKAVNESGLGNHPELVRFCVRIGKAMKEDQLVMPGSQTKSEKVPIEKKFYPGANKE